MSGQLLRICEAYKLEPFLSKNATLVVLFLAATWKPKDSGTQQQPLQYYSMFLQQCFPTKHLLLGPKDLGPGRVVFNFGSSGQILWHPHLCRPRKIWPQSAELEQLQYAAAEGDLLCSKYYRLWSLGFRGEGGTAGGPPQHHSICSGSLFLKHSKLT